MGTSTSANRQFVWGLRYIDDQMLRDRDTDGNGTLDERLYSRQDANWNVTGLVNTSGVIQQRFVYTAYGLPVFLSSSFTSGSNTAAWEVLYAGYRFETAISLMHVRHRVLNPALGCWVQRDPIGLTARTNLYRYCDASSIIFVDPFGLLIPYPTVVLVIALVFLGGVLYYRFYRGLPCEPFTAVQNATVTGLMTDLLRCAKASGVSIDLIKGIEQMQTGGVLVDPGDANAITQGKCTCFANTFFENKSRCQQLHTLLWEAMRVSGNMVEENEELLPNVVFRENCSGDDFGMSCRELGGS